MKPFLKWYTRICGFSAVAAITIQNFILSNLSVLQLPKWLAYGVPFIAATAIYVSLYNFLIWIYETKGWKWVLKQYDISGTWYHEYQSATDPAYIRRRVTYIDQGIWHISLDGRNYDQGLNPASRTMWNSTSVALEQEGRLTGAYAAHRPDQTNPEDPNIEKTGVLSIKIVKNDKGQPCRLVDIFQDSWPSRRRGTLTWRRKTEWSEELEKKEC
jgi:hypothetical protein